MRLLFSIVLLVIIVGFISGQFYDGHPPPYMYGGPGFYGPPPPFYEPMPYGPGFYGPPGFYRRPRYFHPYGYPYYGGGLIGRILFG